MTAGRGASRAMKRNKGKIEKVIPPIWDSTRLVEKLHYRLCQEEETLGEQIWPQGWSQHYRVLEEEREVAWQLESDIAELEYGHATIEDHHIEWGRSNRAIR